MRKLLRRLAGGLLLAMGLALAPGAFAEGEAPEGYEPMKGKEDRAESVDASTLVVAAYGSIFVLMFGFVVYVARSQGEISKQMGELARRLEEAGK